MAVTTVLLIAPSGSGPTRGRDDTFSALESISSVTTTRESVPWINPCFRAST